MELNLSRELIHQNTCDLIEIADDVAKTVVVIEANLKCSHITPIGRDSIEKGFHHTPDVAWGDVTQKYIVYVEAGLYTPRPNQRIRIGNEDWPIRLVNKWPANSPLFYELLLEE